MTRDEHMEWAKKRAREYLNAGDGQQAVTSMLSDLGKHDETKGLVAGPLAMLGIMAAMGPLSEARRFVEGFN